MVVQLSRISTELYLSRNLRDLSRNRQSLAQTFVENIEFSQEKRYKDTMINKDFEEFFKILNKNEVDI